MRCILILAVLVLSSCSSSKFDFSSAYKFSQYQYSAEKGILPTNHGPSGDLMTSLKPVGYTLNNIPNLGQLDRLANLKLLVTTDLSAMSKSRKKQFRKEVRSELKELKKEMKAAKKELKSDDATKRVNRWVYTGLVVGGAGLVLLILDVAAVVGVIALLIGLGFIVYGLLVDGGVIG